MADDDALGELIDRIASLDQRYEDELFVHLDVVSSAADCVRLSLRVVQDGEVDSRWTVNVSEPLECRLSPGPHWDVRVESDHPLLIDVVDDEAELYFKGPVTNAAAVLGDLLRAHCDVVGGWRPIHAYVNEALWNIDLLGTSMGVLASGPVRLVDAYEAVLRRHGAFGSRLEHGPAKIWRGELQWQALKWAPELLLLDSRVGPRHRGLVHPASYVIGRSVTAERVM